jgi:hypothetical protein
MLACLIVGVVRLASTYYANKQSSYAYLASAFALSCGLGLLLAYFGVLGFRRDSIEERNLRGCDYGGSGDCFPSFSAPTTFLRPN